MKGLPERTLVIATGHGLSLALGEGGRLLADHHEPVGLGAAEALMPALGAMLSPFGGSRSGVRHILVEVGPGSFTGLRIGHAAAAALALAWGASLAGVRSTLLVAAAYRDQADDGALGVALAAPRGQYWVERFSMPWLESLGQPLALLPDDLGNWAGDGALVGAPGGLDGAALPRAAVALSLDSRLFSDAVPLYVRPQDDVRNA